MYPVRAATSIATLQSLRITFAQFGIPETVVSDNGQCFAEPPEAISGWSGQLDVVGLAVRARSARQKFGPWYF